jgi:hypothetical protein
LPRAAATPAAALVPSPLQALDAELSGDFDRHTFVESLDQLTPAGLTALRSGAAQQQLQLTTPEYPEWQQQDNREDTQAGQLDQQHGPRPRQ